MHYASHTIREIYARAHLLKLGNQTQSRGITHIRFCDTPKILTRFYQPDIVSGKLNRPEVVGSPGMLLLARSRTVYEK